MPVTYDRRTSRIVQASAHHTGSTVLANALYGIFCGARDHVAYAAHRSWSPSGSVRVCKTHARRPWLAGAIGRRTIIVTSVREGHPSPFTYQGDPRVVIVPYADLLGEEEEIARRVYARLAEKVRGLPDKDEAVRRASRRLGAMNRRYEAIKDKPFSFIDRLYHIHGSHRGRGGPRPDRRARRRARRLARRARDRQQPSRRKIKKTCPGIGSSGSGLREKDAL